MSRILLFLIFVGSLNAVFGQQPTQIWTNRFNGTGDFSQQFNSIVPSGNATYVGGYTVKSGNQRDFYLSKFNSKGDTLWTRAYNGSAGTDDAIVSMIADSAGNIYVSGYSSEKGTGKDICVLKYDATGKQLWKYLYNNQNAGNDDLPVQITLDSEGNVLLVGSSDQAPGSKTNFNFITIKLDRSGNQLWLKSFDSSGEFDDVAIGLSVNTKNEVFVTGNTDNGSDLDIVTLKYTSTGSLAWMKAFNKGKNDSANSICTDKGSVYVVGSTENGKDLDYTILKYSFAGAESWQNGLTYNGAAKGNDEAIAVYTDNAGNLYVAGASDQDASAAQNLDFCVSKYNVNGTEQWTKTWGSSRDKDDRPTFIGATESGLLVIAGTSDIKTDPIAKAGDFQAVGFNTSGTLQWEQYYSASNGFSQCAAATLDNAGNIVLCGKIREDQSKDKNVVLQFSDEGRFNWFKQQEPSGENTDRINDLFLDEAGNTYVCGFTLTSEGQRDFFVQKTDSEGKTVWDFIHNGTGNGNDEALNLSVDLNGNVFVTGYSYEKGNGDDVLTCKISRDGQLQWLVTYDYLTVKGQDRGVDLSLDTEGNVYVTGTSDANLGSGISDDILLLKYNPKGLLLWNKRYVGKAMGDDTPSGIACLSGGKIVLCGTTFNGTDDDILLIGFNETGILQWEQIHNGNIGDDYCAEMTIDNGEKITLIGTSYNGKDNDIVTIQFTSDGTQNWINQYDSGKGNDEGIAVTSDVSRNIYITGTSQNGDHTDIVVRKMSDNGVNNWVDTYSAEGNANAIPTNIAIDNSDFAIVCGKTETIDKRLHTDIFLRKYHPNFGVPVWKKTFDNGLSQDDQATAIAIDLKNNIYLAGTSYSETGLEDIVIIKFDSPLNLHEITYPGTGINLFPNPFTDEVTIDLFNSTGILSIIDIYSLNGKKVKSFKTTKPEMIIDKKIIKTGVYLYNVTQNSEVVQTGKIILK